MPIDLSVIVPTYNRASFLPACVQSIRSCGVENLEIVIADDASTDNTEQVLRTMGAHVRAGRLERNAGPAAARNLGLRLSRGRYVAFLDSDDQWLPGPCPRILDFLDRHPEVGGAFADAWIGNPSTGYCSHAERVWHGQMKHAVAAEAEAGFQIMDRPRLLSRALEGMPIFLGTTILRRETIASIGAFDTEIKGTEDWDLCIRLAARTVFAFCPVPLGIYYQHDGELSKNRELMDRNAIYMLKKVLYDSEPISAADRRQVRRQLRRRLFGWAYQAYDRGDRSEAAARFHDLFTTCGWDAPGAFYWALCSLPSGLVRRLRRLRHRYAPA